MKNRNLVIYIIIFTLLILPVVTGCKKETDINPIKNVAIGGFLNEDEGIYGYAALDNNEIAEFSIVNLISGETAKREFEGIKSVSAGVHVLAGIKNDGTVIVVDFLKTNDINEIDQSYNDWKDILMVEFTLNYAFGLRSDGKIVIKKRNNDNDEVLPDDVLEISKWENIKYISTNGFGLIGVTEKGRIMTYSVPEILESEISKWNDISNVCNGGICTAAVSNDGKVKLATYTMGLELADMSDLKDIKKVEIGIDYVAALTNDGALHIRIFVADAVLVGNELMSDELEKINGLTNVLDIDSYGANLIIMKENGEIIIVEELDD